MGTESSVGQPPDSPGKVDSFHGLIANFYNLKTKKIPAGQLVLGDWLGCNKVFTGVGIFALLGVRKLVSDYQGAFGRVTEGLSQLRR